MPYFVCAHCCKLFKTSKFPAEVSESLDSPQQAMSKREAPEASSQLGGEDNVVSLLPNLMSYTSRNSDLRTGHPS